MSDFNIEFEENDQQITLEFESGVGGAVSSVNGMTGDVVLDADDVGAYTKPAGGIPKTDLASAVQASLGKADSAYQKPSSGIPASDMANGVIPAVDDTLSVAGAAADAKKTGDELSSLKEDISTVKDGLNTVKDELNTFDTYQDEWKYRLAWEIGSVNTDGTDTANTKRIRTAVAKASVDLTFDLSDTTNYQFAIARFDDANMSNPRYTWWITAGSVAEGEYFRVVARRATEVEISGSIYEDDIFKNIIIKPILDINYNAIKDDKNILDNVLNRTFERTYNLWNQDTDLMGRRYGNGEVSVNASWMVTQLIPVNPSTQYICTFGKSRMSGIKVHAFDSNKILTAEISSLVGVFTTGSNDAYVRLSTNQVDQMSSDKKMMVEGSTILPYAPYYRIPIQNVDEFSDLPSYYDSQMASAIASVKTAYNSAGKNKSAFIFFTDPHWGNNEHHTPAIINKLLKKTPLKYVICGGDIITSQDTKVNSLEEMYAFQDAFNFTRNYFFNCIGNHDTNNNSGNQPSEEFTQNEMYATLFSPSETPNIVWGSYYEYYIDNTAEKTRYLFTDTGWFKKWTTDRIKFMEDALNNLDSGWHCVVITHVLYSSGTDIPAFVKVMLDMFDNCNARQAHTISYSDYNTSVTEDGDIHYDFTNAKCEVTMVVAGHTHADSAFATTGGIRCLVMDCDAKSTLSGNPNTVGTVNEQCVTAIIADYDNEVVNCIRIGRGSSATYSL